MAKDLIRYDLLVQDALKGVVRKVLIDAGRDGLAGDHHFYISFRTDFPGVRLSNRLRERYPQDMTIVLQHQFWELSVTEHAFEVGLSFSGVSEKLAIPFDAITGFFDPSVQFGLKFETQGEAAEPAPLPAPDTVEAVPRKPSVPVTAKPARGPRAAPAERKPEPPAAEEKPEADEKPAAGAEVVSLDSFRKKS
ncbi:MAG TPA: ClpXP protease specificity-enhancing factor SspB [Beijerinckiaceae bacterium]|nr:ClpXP protease specificity-enhancing factor SspB [Beijerinckiaceae bacterium]